VLTTEFARANNDYKVLRVRFKDFQGPFTSNFKLHFLFY